ncbi:winged helix-turn-helix transcriptional regulator [Pedobacter sp. BS3]|uniref:SatD family protein n=1 Tax=Pedobacter sp. BS3 TaxID=2567937 RepID=UPI0011EFD60E|nr:SatD family protein [Pedobacter sp. BS3]TZF84820.1 winged helix-turn-helix transcriptional regulator [Pedobacter sp. BS3]
MIAIITGDIVNSRQVADTKKWLSVLKSALNIIDKNNWEIYRGDSFQLKTRVEDALMQAIYIKTCIKTIKDLDIRIAIGIGKQEYEAEKVSYSNGEAFIFSGDTLEMLKKEKVNLAIQSPSADFNEEINVAIRLALTFMDGWSVVTAGIVKAALENSSLSQQELAAKIGKTQSSVSEALKRAHFAEVKELDALYRKKVMQLDSK